MPVKRPKISFCLVKKKETEKWSKQIHSIKKRTTNSKINTFSFYVNMS